MKNIDDFLDEVKKTTGSDYRTAKMIDVVAQHISNWRGRRSMPSNKHIIDMCNIGKVELGAAIIAIEYSRENERPLREAGFADVALLSGMSATGLGVFALSTVQVDSASLILSGVAVSALALYTLYEVDGVLKITLTSEIKTHLSINPVHQIHHLIASNDAVAA